MKQETVIYLLMLIAVFLIGMIVEKEFGTNDKPAKNIFDELRENDDFKVVFNHRMYDILIVNDDGFTAPATGMVLISKKKTPLDGARLTLEGYTIK